MKTRKIVETIIALAAIVLITYPILSSFTNSYTQTVCISQYKTKVDSMEAEEKQRELNRAREYNANIEGDVSLDLSLGTSSEERKYPSYDSILSIDDAMGYISIPEIDVYLPIYHGTSDDALHSGIGHLENTSLPVGGKGTHCVLAGHTGLARMKMFDNIDKLEIGDGFYIHVLGETLTYCVDDINVVKPDDVTKLNIEPEKDYVTLVTCTPYMINTHRLLVRGSRVDSLPEKEDNIEVEIDRIIDKRKNGTVITVLIIILAVIVFGIYIFGGKKKKTTEQNKE